MLMNVCLASGVNDMWNNIIILICIGLFSTSSLTAIAATGESAESVKNTAVATLALNTEAAQLAVSSASIKTEKIELGNNIKNESTAPSIWLLTIALLGFVMLSNRSGV